MGGYPPPGPLDPGTATHAPSYRFRVKQGDRVKLPDGREGTVHMIEHLPGLIHAARTGKRPNALPDLVQIVSVRPDKPRRRYLFWSEHPLRFAETDIDRLELVTPWDEVQRILDDPRELGLEP